jgi:hypothetical protein
MSLFGSVGDGRPPAAEEKRQIRAALGRQAAGERLAG